MKNIFNEIELIRFNEFRSNHCGHPLVVEITSAGIADKIVVKCKQCKTKEDIINEPTDPQHGNKFPKTIGKNLKRTDARALVEWWNGHSKWYHEVRKHDYDKYYDVVRTG